MEVVKITYEDFKKIKANKYDYFYIKNFVAKRLGISIDKIDDIDWNYGLTINVYLL